MAATVRQARTRTWKPGPQRSQLKTLALILFFFFLALIRNEKVV